MDRPLGEAQNVIYKDVKLFHRIFVVTLEVCVMAEILQGRL